MRYVAVDVETTGLGKRCGLLELAMVAEDTTKTLPIEDLPFFRALFWPADAVWEPFAVRIHRKNGLLDEILAGVTQEAAAWCEAEAWLRGEAKGPQKTVEYRNPPETLIGPPNFKVTAAGKNFAGFDRRFLGPIVKCFDYRALDPGSAFADFSKDRLPGLADLLPQDRADHQASHRALDDARDVVRVLRRAYA